MLKAYIPHKISTGEVQTLSDKESRVISAEKNNRLQDPITLVSHSGSYLGIITHIEKGKVEVEVVKKLSEVSLNNEEELKFTIIQAILKREPMNYAIQKLSEVGVSTIIPLETHFSDKPSNAIKTHQEWERISSESRKQSYREVPLLIEKPTRINELKFAKNDLKLCLTVENTDKKSLSDLFKNELSNKKPKNITIAVGPSEGWSIDELNFFKDNGFIMITLGDTILRAETAGLVAVSAIKFHYNLL